MQPTTDNLRPTAGKMLFVLLLVVGGLLLVQHSARAQSVDIIWQAETYTHPFYKGARLWSNQSFIKFVAIPQGFSGNPSSLNYKWTRNGTVLGNINGVGKNSLTLQDSVLSRTQTVKLEILNPEKLVITGTSVTVTPTTPSMAVYEYSPFYGFLFHNEMDGEQALRDREVTLAAFPLFFSANSRFDPSLGYEWRTNTGGREARNYVTYRTPDNASGASRISVETKNSALIMQAASKSFLVQFGEQ